MAMIARTGRRGWATGDPAASSRSTGSGSGESILRTAGRSVGGVTTGRRRCRSAFIAARLRLWPVRSSWRRLGRRASCGGFGGRWAADPARARSCGGPPGSGSTASIGVLELHLDGLDRVHQRLVDEDRLLQVVHELVEQLGAHVGQHAAAELRDPARDREVGDDGDGGAAGVGRERGGDGGVGVALATGLAALGPQHGHVVLGVLRQEGGLALVLRGDRDRPSP